MKKLSIFVYALLFIFLLAEAADADYTGTIGTRFTINGSGFGNVKSKVYLLNGSKQVQAKIESWSDSSITCLWTKKMTAGEYNLFVQPKTKGLTPIPMGTFRIIDPVIDKVAPVNFSVGNTVTVTGHYFSNKKPTAYIEDAVASKKKKCKVLNSTMNPITGESTLQLVVPKLVFDNYKITLKTQIGEVTFLQPLQIDTTPPALNITSHSNGQHVNTSSLTLMGTASDAGKGDNGIQQVTINGSRANGDTASGNETANWSKMISLNEGANPLTVIAYDNSENHNMTTLSITVYYDVIDNAPPSIPTGLTATAVSSSQINLSWNPSPENDVAGYRIYKSGVWLKDVTNGTSTSDTGLSPSTPYCYTVSAYDAIPNESAQSIQACTTTQAVTPPPPPGSFKLPDTGQTTCYDGLGNIIACPPPGNPLAQDGSYNINPLSYTNGNGTVTDNNTGLIWQKEDDGQARTWEEAMNYCDSLPSLGGYSDWRLPSKKELMSIVNYGIPYPGPTIDAVFTNTKSGVYWSSTTYAYDPDYAWVVYFYRGGVYYSVKDDDVSFYVRCVRGGQ